MNAQELFHVWANQRKASGKSGNVFFEGPTCYSYGKHFPIATLKDIPGVGPVALCNPSGYSVSTSKHKTYAFRAIHGRECYAIDPSQWDGITDRATMESAVARQAVIRAEQADAAKIAKREAAKASRDRRKLEKMDMAERLQKWRAGEIPSMPYNAPVALRLIEDGKRIQTSRGAVIPARCAVVAWGLIQAGTPDGEFDWGNYKGLEILPDAVRVGCHVIPMDEIKLMAETLKIA